jgi:hypothetical protein
MPTMREVIRETNRLARMRQGQEVGEFVDIPSIPDSRVCLVPLNEAELTLGLEYAAAKGDSSPDSFSGIQVRSRHAIHSDIWHAAREPSDIHTRVFESIEEMVEQLDPADIDYLNMHLAALMNNASPAMDGLSVDDLDFLGEAWRKITLSELTGRQWAAAKVSLSILLPELLRGRLSGRTSTDGSTTTSESAESTSGALAS